MTAAELETLPLPLVVDSIAASTTWTEVEDRLARDLLVERWWRGIPTCGPMATSTLVTAEHGEKVRFYEKYGPGGRFEWPEEWNRGAWE